MKLATIILPGLASVLAVASFVSVAAGQPPSKASPGKTSTTAPPAPDLRAKEEKRPDRNGVFLEHLLQDVLGRPADPRGLAYYGNLLGQGASRTQVAQAVLGSAEYATVVVGGLYSRLLHRAPDAAGVAYWVSQLQHGVTPEQAEGQIVASDEYAQHAGSGWLEQGYQDLLGRRPDVTSRQQIVLSVVASNEFGASVVASIYQKYLRRIPSAGDQAFMLPVYRQGGSAAVAAMVLGSEEYYQRQ
jgi:hypothetical protein